MALKFAVNNSLSAVTSLPTAIPTGSMTLLQTQTASSSATIDFTSNIDSTYDVYLFKIINCHPATDAVTFQFNFSVDGGSNYNVTKTSTVFLAYHGEDGSHGTLSGDPGYKLAQSTSYQGINEVLGADNDQSVSGTLHLFNPSNTNLIKHFIGDFSSAHRSDIAWTTYAAGYGNTTSAINGIDFKFSSGNIDSGVIKMYGLSKS